MFAVNYLMLPKRLLNQLVETAFQWNLRLHFFSTSHCFFFHNLILQPCFSFNSKSKHISAQELLTVRKRFLKRIAQFVFSLFQFAARLCLWKCFCRWVFMILNYFLCVLTCFCFPNGCVCVCVCGTCMHLVCCVGTSRSSWLSLCLLVTSEFISGSSSLITNVLRRRENHIISHRVYPNN